MFLFACVYYLTIYFLQYTLSDSRCRHLKRILFLVTEKLVLYIELFLRAINQEYLHVETISELI